MRVVRMVANRWFLSVLAVLCFLGAGYVLRKAWMKDLPPVVSLYRSFHDTGRIDFGMKLRSLDTPKRSFSEFAHRKLLLFYFSPSCGHCRHAYPTIRAFRDRYRPTGLEFVAVMTGKATDDDIAGFKEDFVLDLPAFQDDGRRFSKLYNTGTVPLMLLVSPDGTFKAWNSSDSTTLDSLEAAIKSSAPAP